MFKRLLVDSFKKSCGVNIKPDAMKVYIIEILSFGFAVSTLYTFFALAGDCSLHRSRVRCFKQLAHQQDVEDFSLPNMRG